MPGHGNIFGEIATLDGGERTASATAISRVQAMALPQRAMLDLVENNPKVAVAAIRFLCTRLRETDQLLEAIALHRIEVRLARLLLSALKLQVATATGKEVPLDLGMSQGELALPPSCQAFAEDDARFVGHLCVEFLGEVLLEHLQPPDSFDNITTCF